jgi:hypothetical protein
MPFVVSSFILGWLPLATTTVTEDDPNSIKFYINSKALRMLKNKETNSKTKNRLLVAQPNFTQIKFYLWTPEYGVENPFEFRYQLHCRGDNHT